MFGCHLERMIFPADFCAAIRKEEEPARTGINDESELIIIAIVRSVYLFSVRAIASHAETRYVISELPLVHQVAIERYRCSFHRPVLE